MKQILRIYSALLLALVMVFTAHNAAAMRTMQDASGQVVICTGTGPITIYVDDDGQPASPPHFCPDCVTLSLNTTCVAKSAIAIDVVALPLDGLPADQLALAKDTYLTASARAPPSVF